jgi:hypothetical protein
MNLTSVPPSWSGNRAAAFQELCLLEPGLAQLEREIRALPDAGKYFCANEHWYPPGTFRSRLLRLAGWNAVRPELRTSEAYDLAYDYLYALLPDCPECACLAVERAMGLRRRA